MRTTPRDGETASPSHRAEQVLRPISAGLALPAFALMSAGVSLSGASGFWTSTITWGVLAGLIGGKLLGILGTSWADRPFHQRPPHPRLGWADVAGVGVLGGIGFTVSLMITELSYTDAAHLTDAKGAILLASVTTALLAAVILGARNRHHRRIA